MTLSLILVFCLTVFTTEVGSQEQALVTNLDNVNWGPPGGGNGVPVGVQTLELVAPPRGFPLPPPPSSLLRSNNKLEK